MPVAADARSEFRDESRPTRTCDECGAGHLRRISRISITDHLVSQAGLFPYICDVCKRRALRPDYGRMVSVCLGLSLTLALGIYALRLRLGEHAMRHTPVGTPALIDSAGETLTNEDIARLGRVKIPSAVIQRLISGQPHRFQVDPDSLIALKKNGVPDDVILTMVTVTLEHPGLPASAPPPRRASLRPRVAAAE